MPVQVETSGAAAAVEDVLYHLSQSDVDNLFTLVSGLVTVNLFSLLAELLCLGVLLVVVFTIAIRRF